MHLTVILGAALVALLASLPALVNLKTLWSRIQAWSLPGLIPGEAGVVVVNYQSIFAGNGGTTPPTAIQASELPTQTALVFWADVDTAAVVVHNWGLPASFPAFLFPEVWMHKALGESTDSSFATNFTFGIANTNQVTITKIGVGVGSGGTYRVYMRRPGSMEL